MDDATLLPLLLDLVRRLGFEIRTTSLTPKDQELSAVHSGTCVLRGRRLVFLDRTAPAGERCAALLEALRGEDLEGVFIPPAVRHRLDRLD
jgi:hypothetical protein